MNIIEVTCCHKGCGYSPFPMEKGFHDRCRRTHESFLCPAGHSQYFTAKTAEEALIEQLRQKIVWLQEEVAALREQRDHPWCPWPGCDFHGKGVDGLRTHMRAKHGMPSLAAVEEVA